MSRSRSSSTAGVLFGVQDDDAVEEVDAEVELDLLVSRRPPSTTSHPRRRARTSAGG